MEQIQRQPSRKAEPETAEQVIADLRDENLEEEVNCCLAEIDSVLEEQQQDEEEKAVAEFSECGNDEDALRIWQAKYAHLGLEVGWCCGVPYYYKRES